MGKAEIEALLTHLAVEGYIAARTMLKRDIFCKLAWLAETV
jgi:hypothetical protein